MSPLKEKNPSKKLVHFIEEERSQIRKCGAVNGAKNVVKQFKNNHCLAFSEGRTQKLKDGYNDITIEKKDQETASFKTQETVVIGCSTRRKRETFFTTTEEKRWCCKYCSSCCYH